MVAQQAEAAHIKVELISRECVPEAQVAAVAGLPARDGVVVGTGIYYECRLPVALDAAASELDLVADGPGKLPGVACIWGLCHSNSQVVNTGESDNCVRILTSIHIRSTRM